MLRIGVEITGSSPLLMNRFTEEAAAKTSAGTSTAMRAGSQSLPRDQAERKLYSSADGRPMVPGPNVYRGIIDAGIFHKAGKKQITTNKSSLVPAGVWLEEVECFVENPFGGKVEWEVDSRSVVNPMTAGRIMCHRPRFDAWKIKFTLMIDEAIFAEDLVRSLVDDMGTKIGLGDFRPSRKGPFGRFLVTMWQRQSIEKPSTKTKAA